MARTIAEIQQEILLEKEKYSELSALTSTSKTAIWRLWVYIVATAIWLHEKIVDKNALLSRPHTLHWYRNQALSFLYGIGNDESEVKAVDLEWRDGYFQYPKLSKEKVKELSIIKHCAISERLFDEIKDPNGEKLSEVISEYYYNQVGILTLKVAKEDEGGNRLPLESIELRAFRAYMNQIKDAGTQIYVKSVPGNTISIDLEVYVDPLLIYPGGDAPKDSSIVGKLLSNLSVEPVKDVIKEYILALEFNGAFVPTYLIDKIQQIPGVELPILRSVIIDPSAEDKQVVYNDEDINRELPFFVPSSGYFNVDVSDINITYKPYNLQTNQNPNFNI